MGNPLFKLEKKRIVTAWIAALWSGEYKKTSGILKETLEDGEETFCVEGVLADQLSKEGLFRWDENDQLWEAEEEPSCEADEGRTTSLPYSLSTKLALRQGVDSETARRVVQPILHEAYGEDGKTEPLMKEILCIHKVKIPLSELLQRVNDYTALNLRQIGHVIYDLYTVVFMMDLPDKEEIHALARSGSCGDEPEEPEAEPEPESMTSPVG